MNDKLFKLVSYFRTYTFANDSIESIEANASSPLQTELQQSITNGKTLIDLYEQKLHLLTVQNQSLIQETEQLKLTIIEDKKQSEKLLQVQRQVVDQLRKELIEKDEENRLLNERIDHLQVTQADELHLIKTQQNQDAASYEQKFRQEKSKYESMLKTLREDLEDQKEYNSQLIEKINALTQQVQNLTEENQRLKDYIEQSQAIKNQGNPNISDSYKKNQTLQLSYDPNSPTKQTFTPQLQQVTPYEPHATNTSQDQILNYSYQQHQPTALKDVLNCSESHWSRFNMTVTREFFRSKEKENIDENVIKINNSSSPKRLSYLSDGKRMSNKGVLQEKLQSQDKHHEHRIREFSTTDNSQRTDPYFIFFTLTAQCIKINSEYFEEIAQVDLVEKEWNHVIENRIPMNLWGKHLENALLKHVQSL